MDQVSLEILGFVAGATNLMSSVPQLYANLRNPSLARGQSPSRNVLQCTGNLLWWAYGMQIGSVAMTTFALLGTVMSGVLLFQTLGGVKAWARG